MKNNQNTFSAMLLIGVKLLLICAASGLVLSLINGLTAPAISARTKTEETAALEELYSGGTFGDKQEVKETEYPSVVACYAVSDGNKPVGWILELEGQGYGGKMKIMACYQSDGRVLGVKLMENEETPGLGKKAEDTNYMNKFIGKGGEGIPIPVTKEMLTAQQPDEPAEKAAEKPKKGLLRYVLSALLGDRKSVV